MNVTFVKEIIVINNKIKVKHFRKIKTSREKCCTKIIKLYNNVQHYNINISINNKKMSASTKGL